MGPERAGGDAPVRQNSLKGISEDQTVSHGHHRPIAITQTHPTESASPSPKRRRRTSSTRKLPLSPQPCGIAKSMTAREIFELPNFTPTMYQVKEVSRSTRIRKTLSNVAIMAGVILSILVPLIFVENPFYSWMFLFGSLIGKIVFIICPWYRLLGGKGTSVLVAISGIFRLPHYTRNKAASGVSNDEVLNSTQVTEFSETDEEMPDEDGQQDEMMESMRRVGFRDNMKILLGDPVRSLQMEFVAFSFGLLGCVQYLYFTRETVYTADGYQYPSDFQIHLWDFFSVNYAIDYLFRLYIADRRFKYMFHSSTIIDYLAFSELVVMIFESGCDDIFGSDCPSRYLLLGSLRFLRLNQLIVFIKQFMNASDVKTELVGLGMSALMLVCTTAGILLALEFREQQDFQAYGTSFYVSVISITTVGYGDLAPETAMGRAVISFVVVMALILVPIETARFAEIMSLQSKYKEPLRLPDSTFVLVTGELTKENIEEFVQEFFHEDHEVKNVKVLLLSDGEPSVDVKQVVAKHSMDSRLVYRNGSVASKSDFNKYDLGSVKATFVLVDKFTADRQMSDQSSIMVSLAMKSFKPEMTMFVQLFFEANKKYVAPVMSPYDHVFTVDRLSMMFLAYSCECPGFIPLVVNMLATSSVESQPNDPEWVWEFENGKDQEIYRIQIPAVYRGIPFEKAAVKIFDDHEATLFGLKTVTDLGEPIVTLFPCGYEIQAGDLGFILAADQEQADKISDTPDTQPIESPRKNSRRMSRRPSLTRVRSMNLQTAPSSPAKSLEDTAKSVYGKVKVLKKLKECKRREVAEMEDHIVVCGYSTSCRHFMEQLRSPGLPIHSPVVFLSETVPTEKEWSAVANYSCVFFVKGSPLVPLDLNRAAVAKAKRVVILADTNAMRGDGKSLGDANALLIHMSIQMKVKNTCVTELMRTESIELMGSSSQTGSLKGFESNEDYVSGRVFAAAMLDALIVQIFFNPDLLDLLNKLTSTKISEGDNLLAESSLSSVPMPADFVGKTYSELFEHLALNKRQLPLGLYRTTSQTVRWNHSWPYVSPHPDTILHDDDKIFVIIKNVDAANRQKMIESVSKLLQLPTARDSPSTSDDESGAASVGGGPSNRMLEQRMQKMEDNIDLRMERMERMVMQMSNMLNSGEYTKTGNAPTTTQATTAKSPLRTAKDSMSHMDPSQPEPTPFPAQPSIVIDTAHPSRQAFVSSAKPVAIGPKVTPFTSVEPPTPTETVDSLKAPPAKSGKVSPEPHRSSNSAANSRFQQAVNNTISSRRPTGLFARLKGKSGS